MPALSTTFRVLAPDMAGFGYTEHRDDLNYDIKLWVKQLIGFMDALEIKTAHLCWQLIWGLLGTRRSIAVSREVGPVDLDGHTMRQVQYDAGPVCGMVL
jgi:hypothetical protein